MTQNEFNLIQTQIQNLHNAVGDIGHKVDILTSTITDVKSSQTRLLTFIIAAATIGGGAGAGVIQTIFGGQ